MALGDGRKFNRDLGALEKCILFCGAPKFEALGGWTKEPQNALVGPEKCIFGRVGALNLMGLGDGQRKFKNAAWKNAFCFVRPLNLRALGA